MKVNFEKYKELISGCKNGGAEVLKLLQNIVLTSELITESEKTELLKYINK